MGKCDLCGGSLKQYCFDCNKVYEMGSGGTEVSFNGGDYLRNEAREAERPEADECGNIWYPFEVARHWSLGVPVVVRVTARETGLFIYSIASRWKSPGINTFGESAMFLMLDRMPQ